VPDGTQAHSTPPTSAPAPPTRSRVRSRRSYLIETAGIKEVATIHDKKTYGQGLVEAFTAEFAEGRQDRRGRDDQPGRRQVLGVISKIKPSARRRSTTAASTRRPVRFSQQMKASRPQRPAHGRRRHLRPEFIKLAGATADRRPRHLGRRPDRHADGQGKDLPRRLQEGRLQGAVGAYGAYAYDAANAIIEALKVSLKDADSAEAARQATIDAMARSPSTASPARSPSTSSATRTTRVLTVYKVSPGGKWEADKTSEFK
jgi:branched-chain amino acid transport system substrate-binding protein